MKQCFKCGKVKPLSEFYKHPAMGDGHLNKCKECTKLDATRHRAANLERVQSYDRARGARPGRINPVHRRANIIVSNAVRDGRLAKRPCEVCGEAKSEAHHEDYSKPLDVVWLCRRHHMERHRKYDYDELMAAV